MLYTLQAFCSDIVHFAQVCFVAFSRKCLSLCVILLKLWGWASNLPQCPSYVSHKHAGTLTHDACDCVIHQPLGRNGVATAQTNKLINQAGWGVGGRRTQQWISLSYFTALLISTCIDDDCSHSVRGDYCFHNMQERRHCVVIYAQVCYVYTDAFWVEGWFPFSHTYTHRCTHPPTHTQVSSWRRVSLQLSEWSKVNSFLLFLYVHFPVIDQKKRSCFLVSDLFWNMWVAWVYVCSARCAWTYCDKGSQQKILVMNCKCIKSQWIEVWTVWIRVIYTKCYYIPKKTSFRALDDIISICLVDIFTFERQCGIAAWANTLVQNELSHQLLDGDSWSPVVESIWWSLTILLIPPVDQSFHLSSEIFYHLLNRTRKILKDFKSSMMNNYDCCAPLAFSSLTAKRLTFVVFIEMSLQQ